MNFERTVHSQIRRLGSNEIFVFGSNLAGIHGAGAAAQARLEFGAKQGVGFGPTGQCYAIPTKDFFIDTMPISAIKVFVDKFLEYAKNTEDKLFLVTEIGCGLANYKAEEIAPLFEKAWDLKNVHLPLSFWEVLTPANRLRFALDLLDNAIVQSDLTNPFSDEVSKAKLQTLNNLPWVQLSKPK